VSACDLVTVNTTLQTGDVTAESTDRADTGLASMSSLASSVNTTTRSIAGIVAVTTSVFGVGVQSASAVGAVKTIDPTPALSVSTASSSGGKNESSGSSTTKGEVLASASASASVASVNTGDFDGSGKATSVGGTSIETTSSVQSGMVTASITTEMPRQSASMTPTAGVVDSVSFSTAVLAEFGTTTTLGVGESLSTSLGSAITVQMSGFKTPAFAEGIAGNLTKTGVKSLIAFSSKSSATATVTLSDAVRSVSNVGQPTTSAVSSSQKASTFQAPLGLIDPFTTSDAASSRSETTATAVPSAVYATVTGGAVGEVTATGTGTKAYIIAESPAINVTVSEEEVVNTVQPSTATASIELAETETDADVPEDESTTEVDETATTAESNNTTTSVDL